MLERASPYTKPMFGSTAVYIGEQIVLILRSRDSYPSDNGIWVATTQEHHPSLRAEFPSLRSIAAFGPGETGWQVLPEEATDFEEAAHRLCALVLRGDPRIGKIPKTRKPRGTGRSGRAKAGSTASRKSRRR
jgi:hypothetical protein